MSTYATVLPGSIPSLIVQWQPLPFGVFDLHAQALEVDAVPFERQHVCRSATVVETMLPPR